MSVNNNKLYNILGISKLAEASEIRKAYQKLVLSAHPDHGGSNEKFQEIKKAYDVLIDPFKRSKYDRNGQIEINETVYIVTDAMLQKCRERYRASESEKRAIRNAWVTHRGNIVKTLKDIPFMWASYTDSSDAERNRVERIVSGNDCDACILH